MAKRKHKKRNTQTINILNDSNNTQFDYAEVFRHIRTNIEYSSIDEPVKAISITSTQPNEAKTTLSMNLAFSFATKYEKVLIVDCDLRKSMLHRYLNISNDAGLTDALLEFSKTKTLDGDYFKTVDNDSFVGGHLYVLTTGTKVPNPSEMLASESFSEFMKLLKDHFDFVICDCAPAGAISDAIPVGNAVDGTVFVISAMDTKRKDALGTINMLKRNNVRILGGVLTKANQGSSGYYYYYY